MSFYFKSIGNQIEQFFTPVIQQVEETALSVTNQIVHTFTPIINDIEASFSSLFQKENKIDTVPDDVMGLIFSNLSHSTLMVTSCVSTKWHDYSVRPINQELNTMKEWAALIANSLDNEKYSRQKAELIALQDGKKIETVHLYVWEGSIKALRQKIIDILMTIDPQDLNSIEKSNSTPKNLHFVFDLAKLRQEAQSLAQQKILLEQSHLDFGNNIRNFCFFEESEMGFNLLKERHSNLSTPYLKGVILEVCLANELPLIDESLKWIYNLSETPTSYGAQPLTRSDFLHSIVKLLTNEKTEVRFAFENGCTPSFEMRIEKAIIIANTISDDILRKQAMELIDKAKQLVVQNP